MLCNVCQWTNRDDDLLNEEPKNPMEKHLNEILSELKELNGQEKAARDRKLQTTKRLFYFNRLISHESHNRLHSFIRLSNLGILPNDRYGLQAAQLARKKVLDAKRPQRNSDLLATSMASSDVPGELVSIEKSPIRMRFH